MKTKEKICNKCKQKKPVQEFNRYAKMADGRYSTCRTCVNEKRQAEKVEKKKVREKFFDPNTPAF